jgi:hypothetical protein
VLLDVKTLVAATGVGATDVRPDLTLAGVMKPAALRVLPSETTTEGRVLVPTSLGGSGALAVAPATATAGATGRKPELAVVYGGTAAVAVDAVRGR